MGDIEFIYLADKDVVRHEIVQKTIRAYQQYDGERLASDEKVGA
jgi:phosphate starvation-inducible PhoH-like protein